MTSTPQAPTSWSVPGQPTWQNLIDTLTEEHGSVIALATKLSELGGWRDDAESIARALRRLRSRGSAPGGKWGDRVIAAFGLPRSTQSRLRFMGAYHSRFVDLPASLALDLISLWDRPPTQESHDGRAWLSLARMLLAMRNVDVEAAWVHLETAEATRAQDPLIRAESALGRARLETDASPSVMPKALKLLDALLPEIEAEERECVHARLVGQIAYVLNRNGHFEEGEAMHRALPDTPCTHPFARSRRANGIAYARYRLGDETSAAEFARRAAMFAGDAGHIRLRAMALLMLSRVASVDESVIAIERARAIATSIEDSVLLHRCQEAMKRLTGVSTGTLVEP